MRNFWIIFLGVILLLPGCTTKRQELLNEGYPLHYADGFEDGYHSGKSAAGNMFEGLKKDVARYEKDRQYAQGWTDGFNQGKGEQEAWDRSLTRNIEQQQLYEQRKHNDYRDQSRMEREAVRGLDTSGLENFGQ